MGQATSGVGHFTIPTAPAAGTSCTSGAANTFTTTYVQLIASTAAAIFITGIYLEAAAVSAATYIVVQLATGGAGSETVVDQCLIVMSTGSTVARGYKPIWPPIPVANATRIAVKTADSVGSQANLITLECINQSNVVDDGIAVGTVTTVTNQLTAAAIATGVWQDAVAGDFTAASSIGKALYIANVAPGAAGGHFISGANTGPMTVSGGVTFSSSTGTGFTCSSSGSNGNGASFVGNGTGTGYTSLGGATGQGAIFGGGATSGSALVCLARGGNAIGLDIQGLGSSAGMSVVGGATGIGLSVVGGATSGDGVKVTTTSGHGVNLAPVGTNMHGLLSTGGNGGTSDGIKAVAGTGGVDIRGNITGNLVGTVSTLTTYTGNTVQTGDSYARLGAPAGASIAADLAEIEAETDGIAAIPTTTPLTAAQIATGVWTDTTAGDFTAALSVGKSVMNGVALGTGLTVNDLTTKTGYALSATGLNAVLLSDLPGVPASNAMIVDGLSFLFMGLRNERDTTAASDKVTNNAGAAIGTATLSDDGTTFIKTKYA